MDRRQPASGELEVCPVLEGGITQESLACFGLGVLFAETIGGASVQQARSRRPRYGKQRELRA
jgi:hypothetical protein